LVHLCSFCGIISMKSFLMPPMKVASLVPRQLISSSYLIGFALLLLLCVACATIRTTGAAAERLPSLALQAEPDLAPAVTQVAAGAIAGAGYVIAPVKSHPLTDNRLEPLRWSLVRRAWRHLYRAIDYGAQG
jgi:hypothetical protein